MDTDIAAAFAKLFSVVIDLNSKILYSENYIFCHVLLSLLFSFVSLNSLYLFKSLECLNFWFCLAYFLLATSFLCSPGKMGYKRLLILIKMSLIVTWGFERVGACGHKGRITPFVDRSNTAMNIATLLSL